MATIVSVSSRDTTLHRVMPKLDVIEVYRGADPVNALAPELRLLSKSPKVPHAQRKMLTNLLNDVNNALLGGVEQLDSAKAKAGSEAYKATITAATRFANAALMLTTASEDLEKILGKNPITMQRRVITEVIEMLRMTAGRIRSELEDIAVNAERERRPGESAARQKEYDDTAEGNRLLREGLRTGA